jgi:hypothetical protein
MVGEEKMTNCCVCDLSCQVLHLHQLVQKISKLTEIVAYLGISTNQNRKLFTFFPDMSARRKLLIFIGRRSTTASSKIYLLKVCAIYFIAFAINCMGCEIKIGCSTTIVFLRSPFAPSATVHPLLPLQTIQ